MARDACSLSTHVAQSNFVTVSPPSVSTEHLAVALFTPHFSHIRFSFFWPPSTEAPLALRYTAGDAGACCSCCGGGKNAACGGGEPNDGGGAPNDGGGAPNAALLAGAPNDDGSAADGARKPPPATGGGAPNDGGGGAPKPGGGVHCVLFVAASQ